MKRDDLGNILSYQFPSPDGDIIVGVGLLGLTLIHMPPVAAASGAVLQSEDVIEAMVDADATLAQRYRQHLRTSEMQWLDNYLEELRDEIDVENQFGWNSQQLELFDSDDYTGVVMQQKQHDVGF